MVMVVMAIWACGQVNGLTWPEGNRLPSKQAERCYYESRYVRMFLFLPIQISIGNHVRRNDNRHQIGCNFVMTSFCLVCWWLIDITGSPFDDDTFSSKSRSTKKWGERSVKVDRFGRDKNHHHLDDDARARKSPRAIVHSIAVVRPPSIGYHNLKLDLTIIVVDDDVHKWSAHQACEIFQWPKEEMVSVAANLLSLSHTSAIQLEPSQTWIQFKLFLSLLSPF